MRRRLIYLFMLFLYLTGNSYSQGFLITPPRLTFDGYRLLISYDLISKDPSDIFFVWVEIYNKSGALLNIKAVSGDLGEHITPGNSKRISWIPEKDEIFLNEEVTVEVMAEKYLKSFNKGSMILLSTVIPGLGQTKISRGRPWWLAGVAVYGAMTGGIITRANSKATFDSYSSELNDPVKRAELYNQYSEQAGISDALMISGALVWTINIFWVALTPNPYQPLKHLSVSLNQSSGSIPGTLLTLKVNF